MARLSLSLLGPFQATLDGEPIAGFNANKVRALLAYLATEESHHPGGHPRTVLAGLLWPDKPERAALTNLRTALANLRTAIGDRDAVPPYLLITRETIQFNSASDHWLDVATFQALVETTAAGAVPVKTASAAPAAAAPAAAARPTHQRLQEAVALYRGDLLAGFAVRDSPEFEEWVLLLRERLHLQALEALGTLAAYHEGRGAYKEAIACARRQVELEPWREDAHRTLIRALALSGQRAAALAQYQACRQVLEDELGVAPSAETTALYERIRGGLETPAAPSSPLHNLPAQLSPFVGRQTELAEISALLEDPACRLLNLVGPGGSGKTRLALEVAAGQLDRFADGVFFVSLAPLQSVEAILPTIAQALSLRSYGEGAAKELLLHYLQPKEVLLILDNYEHLLEGAGVATEILTRAPDVKILVTSRTKLNVGGEQLYPIRGLEYPETWPEERGDVDPSGAIHLFLSGARRVRPGYKPAREDLAQIAKICRWVGGMPLALLLAAAWMEMLTPAEIAAELEPRVGLKFGRGIDFLEADLRDAPERQRSIRAVFDHSWRLLAPREREILARLSVFRGGFTREAAQQIAGASLRDLMSLVNRSLTFRTAGGRFEIHELLRQYGAEVLERSHEAREAAHDAHCAHYTASLARWADELRGARQQAALAEAEREIENAHAAWNWAIQRTQMERIDQAMDGLGVFYRWRARYEEGVAAYRAAADRLDESAPHSQGESAAANRLRLLGRALTWQGHFGSALGQREAANRCYEHALAALDRAELSDPPHDVRREKAFTLREMSATVEFADLARARKLAERSLELCRALDDRREMADCLYALGKALRAQDALEEAQRLFEESLSLRRALGDRLGMVGPLNWANYGLANLGRIEEAERMGREAVAIAQHVGGPILAGWANYSLGFALRYAGRFVEARSLLEESLASFREWGHRTAEAWGLWSLGLTAKHLGAYEEAQAATEAALTRSQESGLRTQAANCHVELGRLSLAEGAYGAAQEWLQQSIAIYREIGGMRWNASEAPAVLAYAARGLGQPAQARQHLGAALRTAAEFHAHNTVLHALPAVALLLVDGGETERAVELYALASRYPYVANSRWFEDVAGREIAVAAESLPRDVVADAQERGRARDLWATVEELLAEWVGEDDECPA